jgi:hypothetical protein
MVHRSTLFLLGGIGLAVLGGYYYYQYQKQQQNQTSITEPFLASGLLPTTTDSKKIQTNKEPEHITDIPSNSHTLQDPKVEINRRLRYFRKVIRRFEALLWKRFQHGDSELTPLRKYIEQLHHQIDKVTIHEDPEKSYSQDKRSIFLCMRDASDPQKLIGFNTVCFVLIHELSHIACPCEEVHGKEFMEIFKHLLYQAIRYGIWNPVYYPEHITSYCGVTISLLPLKHAELEKALKNPLPLFPHTPK